jgi:hypothetical protein
LNIQFSVKKGKAYPNSFEYLDLDTKPQNSYSSKMKTTIISVVIAGLFAVASAAPASGIQARQSSVTITFYAAAAEFTQSFPTDGSTQPISMWHSFVSEDKPSLTIMILANNLSVNLIEGGAAGITCTFDGINGSVTTVVGTETEPVGPPQTQISGSCAAS